MITLDQISSQELQAIHDVLAKASYHDLQIILAHVVETIHLRGYEKHEIDTIRARGEVDIKEEGQQGGNWPPGDDNSTGT